MESELDTATLEWMGKIDGAATGISVIDVGNGPYGIVEIMTSDEREERTLRYIGFETTQEADYYARYFLTPRGKQIERQTDATPKEREHALAVKQDRWDHTRFQIVHLAPATMNHQLDTIASLFDNNGKEKPNEKTPTQKH
jgi:hypothetical protein